MYTVARDYKTEVVEVNGRLELRRVELKSWWCAGPRGRTYHPSESAALKQAEANERFDAKFPYIVPLGKRTGK